MPFLFQKYIELRGDEEINTDPRDHPIEDYDGPLLVKTVCEMANDIYTPPLPTREQKEEWERSHRNDPFNSSSLFSVEEKRELGQILNDHVVTDAAFKAALKKAKLKNNPDHDPDFRFELPQINAISKALDDAKLIEMAKVPRFQELIVKRLGARDDDYRVREFKDYLKLVNKQEKENAKKE